jgi:rubrerythrin
MKRLTILLAVAVLACTAILGMQGSENPIGEIDELLQHAYGNELMAVARYTAFAKKADEEGFKGVATLFRAAAKAEQVHAQRFGEALKKRNIKPVEIPYEPEVRATRENLLSSMEMEREERDNIYLAGMKRAKELGQKEAAELFDLVRSAETEHANLCTIANAMFDDQKGTKTYHVCNYCGYTTDVKLARCPSCMGKGEMVDVK